MTHLTQTVRAKVIQIPTPSNPITVVRYQVCEDFDNGEGYKYRGRLGEYHFLATVKSPEDKYDLREGVKWAFRKLADKWFGDGDMRIVANALWKQLCAVGYWDDTITIKLHTYA